MQTIIPLNQPPNSPEWQKLLGVLADKSAAVQCTVIINPACGPGPRKPWEDRRHWLGLMARIRGTGARLALYLRARNAEVCGEPGGGRWEYHRRKESEILRDIEVWRAHFLTPIGDDTAAWWIDRHPSLLESLEFPEVKAMYAALGRDYTIANVRSVAAAEWARHCPARALAIHCGTGWPPMTEPTLAGKPTAIIATGQSALMPGAKKAASFLYVTPENHGDTFATLSPLLPRILSLNS